MKRTIGSLLRRWGNRLAMVTEEGVSSFSAVLTPVTSASLQNMQRQMADLGQLEPGQFLYIGDRDISGAAYLLMEGEVYLPRRCEAIRLGNETLFYWGLAAPAGKENQWNR